MILFLKKIEHKNLFYTFRHIILINELNFDTFLSLFSQMNDFHIYSFFLNIHCNTKTIFDFKAVFFLPVVEMLLVLKLRVVIQVFFFFQKCSKYSLFNKIKYFYKRTIAKYKFHVNTNPMYKCQLSNLCTHIVHFTLTYHSI